MPPSVCGIKLLQIGKMGNKDFFKNFIPLWNKEILKGRYCIQILEDELIVKIPPSVFCRFEGLQNTNFYLTDKTLVFFNSNPIS